MSKGIPNKRQTGEFKQQVVEYMIEHKLSSTETGRIFETDHKNVALWERIHLTEGVEGLYLERRGRGGKGKGVNPPKTGRERFNCGESAATSRGGLPKKLASHSVETATSRERTQIVSTLRHKHNLAILLDVAQLARATYYYHAKQQTVPNKYLETKIAITAIYHENKGRYGYRRITEELHRRGYGLNHKTVRRLTKELGLTCRVRMKKYHSYKGEVGKIAPNLLQRNFEAEKPNQKWVTDVTEFNLFGQKLYLSPILDLCSRDIVSYSISDRPVLSMVTQMPDEAFAKIPDGANLILHSDQGWHYQNKQYQQMLKAKGIRQSMSRKGNCLDNAVIENFFGLLKSELLYLMTFASLAQFKVELIDYLHYYNNRRIKAKLKGLPPAIHRQQALSAA